MTLRSQLRAFPIVVAGAMLILGVALILRVQVMNHALERESGIDRLIYEVSMLKSVILDYQLHESARAMRQWRVIDQRLTASLTALSFTHSHEQRLFERVVSTYSRVQAIVAELQSQPSGSAAVDAAAAPLPGAYTDILVSQLIILSQDVISQSFQLQHRIKQRMITINQATLLMVGGVAAIVVLSVFGISWQVERRLARSINTLIAIAHQIQDGKLEFVVPVAEQDDFQVVYAAFRQMLARLQHTYQGLQREIQERQQIMEALRDNERQLCAAKDALECANTKLRHVNADKDKFFSILAHDLRNPLNSILAFGSLLENLEHRDAAERKLLTGEFQSLINNLLALLENLLTWSRIQRGELPYTPEACNLHTLIEHSFALLRPAADQKQVTLTHTVPQDIDLHVDVNMADTIIRNLVANAIKFTPANGTVTVSSIRRDNLVEIEVSDTGIGIPADKLGSLFQIGAKFQRKGTAGEKGTGLGLILCREFVERHGGRIWCDSTVGQGTSLRFRLPASVSRKNVAF